MHGFVKEGMNIHLTYGDPTNIIGIVNERLEAMRKFKPQVILLYSCVVRKTFWEDFVDMEMKPFAKLCSTCGFHTWGGEKFFILLPKVDEERAAAFAENLRRTVDLHVSPAVGHLTISQGVITVHDYKEQKQVYIQVDDALYKAKKAGRNRVEQAPPLYGGE
ncbi:MAG: diguanylate cyclase [Clostridia bacterium]|nr:diguanylate cyclase [Clostridia bacterium]